MRLEQQGREPEEHSEVTNASIESALQDALENYKENVETLLSEGKYREAESFLGEYARAINEKIQKAEKLSIDTGAFHTWLETAKTRIRVAKSLEE